MPKSRFFRVAVEGATTDGRAIERQWLIDAAETYDRSTYAARVNLEHIRGVTADPPFQALGDVLSLRTEQVQLTVGGKNEKRLALFAEIDALDPLVAMNKAGQKLYSSIEISPNFAGTNKAYLVGLAVTDSPASLGTEMLQFAAAQGDKSPLRARKLDPANLFSVAEEFQLELADETDDPATGLIGKIAAFFDGLTARQVEPPPAPAAPAVQPGADATAFTALTQAMSQAVTELATSFQAFAQASSQRAAALEGQVAEIAATLERTPATAFAQRQPATGGDNRVRTDC
ncbi:GPO family capsid scaffolding protein [Novosphingobium capsulatum]|uniref:GPO family capsid scaffolding protein n=1 Tax=Novosphingobium capsulatum TaxID=13688 RepID=UPI0007868F94|nr:GPO family capsid scaffolding protein [Novosphingobium capsulatum]WQD92541.1 GPO family capsid scaffolding protein [Novosphingobium capsulatum]